MSKVQIVSVAFLLFRSGTGFTVFGWILLASCGGLWILLNTYLMFYFEVNETHLFVKNHNMFWIKKAYKLTSIKSISFESISGNPGFRLVKNIHTLKLETQDFKTKTYRANTLTDKNWLKLGKALKGKNLD